MPDVGRLNIRFTASSEDVKTTIDDLKNRLEKVGKFVNSLSRIKIAGFMDEKNWRVDAINNFRNRLKLLADQFGQLSTPTDEFSKSLISSMKLAEKQTKKLLTQLQSLQTG